MGILLSPHYNKGVHGRLQGGRGVLAPRGSRKHRSVAPGTYMMAQKVGNWLESEICFVGLNPPAFMRCPEPSGIVSRDADKCQGGVDELRTGRGLGTASHRVRAP